MKLRDLFPGYLGYSDEEIDEIWKNAVIFFDTNCLLNLFEYSKVTFDKFLENLESEYFKGRLYITYQVGLEYGRNRSSRLEKQSSAPKNIESILNKSKGDLISAVRSEHKMHSIIDIDGVIKDIEIGFDNAMKKIHEGNSEILAKHQYDVQSAIERFFDDCVTAKPSPEWLKSVYKEGQERYAEKIPPGFADQKDKADDSRKYGDLVIWREILQFCQDNKKEHVIFITDDMKEDWWSIEKGKTLGCHPLLVQEMRDHGIKYLQYSSERFLKYSSERLKKHVTEDILSEVKEVSSSNEALVEIARQLSYSPSTTLRRIRALEEVKMDKEMSSRKFYDTATEEIDRMIGEAVRKDREFSTPVLQLLYDKRKVDPDFHLNSYLIRRPTQRSEVINQILGEMEREAELERAKSLRLLRERHVARSKALDSNL